MRTLRARAMALAVGSAVWLTCLPAYAVEFQFVDTLSAAATPNVAGQASAQEIAFLVSLDTATLEPAVRYLASPALQGRGRASAGNELARRYLIERLERAGLAPLFGTQFDQEVQVDGQAGTTHGFNVGAIYRANDPDADWIVLVAHYDHLGVRGGNMYPGADDNASSVALLLSLADALGKARPSLAHHVAFLFPDAEEPPDIRTENMGSSWFWRKPPMPLGRMRCAIVLDLLGGVTPEWMRRAGLGNLLYVLGAEASPGLARLAQSVPPVRDVDPLLIGLPMIEAYPYVATRRFARSDYYGLREIGQRPFLFLTAGRSANYHTPNDTPDTLDYALLAAKTRWVGQLMLQAAQGMQPLGWVDNVADPIADARALLRLTQGVGDAYVFTPVLRDALVADRRRTEELRAAWESGRPPTQAEYRKLQLAALRFQAAVWDPTKWYWSLW